MNKKIVGPILVITCFFLPWVTPSCSSRPLSGLDIAINRGASSPIPDPLKAIVLFAIPLLGIVLLILSKQNPASQWQKPLAGIGVLILGMLYLYWNLAPGSKIDLPQLIKNVISDVIYMPLGPLQLRNLLDKSGVGLVSSVWRNQSEIGFWGTYIGFIIAGFPDDD